MQAIPQTVFWPEQLPPQPVEILRAGRGRSLRNFWHFHAGWKWRNCLITGNSITLSSHAEIRTDGLFIPSNTWFETGCTLPLAFTPSPPITILIGSRQLTGGIGWMIGSEWTGYYSGEDGNIISTQAADFSGSVTPIKHPRRDPHGLYWIAVTMSGANDLRASINGGPIAADTSCAAPSGPVDQLKLGSSGGANNPADIICRFFGLWDRAFSDTELMEVSGNPRQLFRPRSRLFFLAPSSSAGAITGNASITLGALTSSSTTTIALAGAAAVSLDAVTTNSNAALAIAGSCAFSLADVTTSATGALAIVGSSAVNFDALGLSSASAIAIASSSAITLDAATVTATGVLSAVGTGQAAISLANASISADGALAIKATSSLNLDNLSTSSVGVLPLAASGSIVLASLVPAITSAIAIKANASISLSNASVASNGSATGIGVDTTRIYAVPSEHRVYLIATENRRT